MVFGRSPEVPGDLLTDNPGAHANSSALTDPVSSQLARVRTAALMTVMAHQDNMAARRALADCPHVVPHLLPGDMVAVWCMTNHKGTPGKRTHHRWQPGI